MEAPQLLSSLFFAMALTYYKNLAIFVCPLAAVQATYSGHGGAEPEANEDVVIENCFLRDLSDDMKGVIMAHPDYLAYYPLYNCAYVVDYAKWVMADYLKMHDPRWGEYQELYAGAVSVPRSMPACLNYNAARAAYFTEEADDNLAHMEAQLEFLLQTVRASRQIIATADKTTAAGANLVRTCQARLVHQLNHFDDQETLEPLTYYLDVHGPR
jgi:hypothetical protein